MFGCHCDHRNLQPIHADALIELYKNQFLFIRNYRRNLDFWTNPTFVKEGEEIILYIQDSAPYGSGVDSGGVRCLIEDIIARGYSELPVYSLYTLVPLEVRIAYEQSVIAVHLKFTERNKSTKCYHMAIKYHIIYADVVMRILSCLAVA